MKNKLIPIQMFVLLGGTGFSWYTVYKDFARFYERYGSLTRIKDCVIPNPVTTPCFYGAFAFLLSAIWAIQLFKLVGKEGMDTENVKAKQKRLNWLLIASTIFAWSNFSLEAFKFYTSTAVEKVSCSGIPTTNVFATPCFQGASIFLVALIVSIVIRKVMGKSTETAKN